MGYDIERLSACVPKITAWFRLNGKHFAWRDDPTPYHVWVSEIMLQQTRIEAVIGYYDRFIWVLPDIQSLSEVSDEVLMKLWQGLGYYARARNLKKAAGIVMREYNGQLPASAQELQKLPGIGAYTAGAIASIAMNRPEPAVDGNVLRVLMRVLGEYDDVMLDKTKKAVHSALKQVYPTNANEASLLTQGLMELGEVLCAPVSAPLCEDCPIKAMCVSYERHLTDQLPVRKAKTERRVEERTVLIIKHGESYALKKRPDRGLLAGLWEFPNKSGFLTGDELAQRFPGASSVEYLGDAGHIFTHIEWRLRCWRVCVSDPPEGFVWASKAEIHDRYAVPGAFRFCLDRLE